MQIRNVLVIVVFAVTLAACSKAPPTIGERTEFTAACNEANKGKRVAVEGYLRFPDSFKSPRDVVLRLYQTDDFTGQPIGVVVDFGAEPNQVEPVAKEFSDTDLKVHLASGKVTTFGTKVRVSGDLSFPLVSMDFGCLLENPLIEAAD